MGGLISQTLMFYKRSWMQRTGLDKLRHENKINPHVCVCVLRILQYYFRPI